MFVDIYIMSSIVVCINVFVSNRYSGWYCSYRCKHKTAAIIEDLAFILKI